MGYLLGVDTGGTFTDVVVLDAEGNVWFDKAFTTPHRPALGVLAALENAARRLSREPRPLLEQTERFAHGTTVGTNALIQRKGARVGLLMTKGFEDTLLLGRGPMLRNLGIPPSQAMDFLRTERPEPLVPRQLTRGIAERVAVDGQVLAPLQEADVASALAHFQAEGVESVAVCLLWSFKEPAHEERIRAILGQRAPNLLVTLSCEVSPFLGEFERAIVMASDFAAGREMAEAFMKTFTAAGGQVVQQVYAPLGTPDFAPFIGRLKPEQADVVYAWFAGAEPARIIKQLKEYGFTKPLVSQGAFAPNYALQAIGETGLPILTAKQYADTLETPENRRFVAAFLQKYQVKPDGWAEQGYVGAKAVVEAAKAVGGKVEDRPAFLAALRTVRFQGPAGAVWFDENQQRVFDVYIRKVEKVGNEYVNKVIDKIPNASQNWRP